MSLIKCHECGKRVSTEASSCPNCGAKPRIPVPVAPAVRLKQLKYLAIGITSIFLVNAAYNAYSEWAERRAQKKAEVAEFMRRNSMTPQQRIYEDKIKAERIAREQEARKQEAEKKARYENNRGMLYACREALIGTLNDPGSFSYIDSYGGQDDIEPGVFNAFVKGRARNAFGALIAGTWMCKVTQSGPNLIVNSVRQISPRIN